jgi:hypothetical protein
LRVASGIRRYVRGGFALSYLGKLAKMFAGLDKQIGRTGFGGPPQVESCVVFASKFLSVPSRQMFLVCC